MQLLFQRTSPLSTTMSPPPQGALYTRWPNFVLPRGLRRTWYSCQALYPRRSYIMWSQRLWPEFLDMECSRCFSFNGRDWYIVILFCVLGYRGPGEVFIKKIAANLLIEFSGLSGFILTTVVSSPREYCITSCASVRPLVYQPMASVTRYSHCTFSIVRKTAAFLQTELDYYFKSIVCSLRSSHLPAIARQRQ